MSAEQTNAKQTKMKKTVDKAQQRVANYRARAERQGSLLPQAKAHTDEELLAFFRNSPLAEVEAIEFERSQLMVRHRHLQCQEL